MLHAACWKYRTQKIAISAPSHNFVGCIFTIKACIDNQKKKLLNSNSSSTCPHNMVNFGPLTAEIGSGVWGTPANFNGLVKLCGVEQRAPPVFGRVAIVLGIGPHSSSVLSNSCICHEFSLNTFLPVNTTVYVYHRTVSEFY